MRHSPNTVAQGVIGSTNQSVGGLIPFPCGRHVKVFIVCKSLWVKASDARHLVNTQYINEMVYSML